MRCGPNNEYKRHCWDRKRVGPTGRKSFTVIADVCSHCSLTRPIKRRYSYQQLDWIRRWNRQVKAAPVNVLHKHAAGVSTMVADWRSEVATPVYNLCKMK